MHLVNAGSHSIKMKEKTRNGGTWTEAQFFGHLRSSLRRAFRYWKPLINAKLKARRKYSGHTSRQKWEYQCNQCGEWFKGSECEVDHITPVGSLKSLDDIIGFIERLTPEDIEAFQVLCKECHKKKSLEERKKRNE